MSIIMIIALLLMGYLLGSIPFSYLFGKWLGHGDVRKYGSGNVGTTNVMRTFGKKIGVLAFLGDFFKGVLAAYIGMLAMGTTGAAIAGVAAVVGHCYTIFLNFSGGKGVATSAGVVGFIMPMALVIGVPMFAIVVLITRYVSVGSLSVFVMAFILAIVRGEPISVIIAIALVGMLAFYRHWGNICRLRKGEERKVGQHKKES